MGDPYKNQILSKNIYNDKRDVYGTLVVIMDTMLENRGLELIVQPSRAVTKHQIHEMIITCEDVGPSDVVNKVAYMGFFEVESGGVVLVGDSVYVDDRYIGKVAGFDETHYPNHLNLVIKSTERRSGVDLGLKLSDSVKFVFAGS